MLNIETPYEGKYSFLHLGFRPFFSAGMAFAVLGIIAWMIMYFMGKSPVLPQYTSMLWHGHEMVFGYGAAIVAGFLLTAVKNWTGVQTLNGWPLFLLFVLWLCARVLSLVVNESLLPLLIMIDVLFNVFLAVAVTLPIVKVKQWGNMAFAGKIYILVIANIVFYMGLLGYIDLGTHYGLYAGLYTVLAVVLTMGRRVIPFFIEKGVEGDFVPKNWKWLDISSLILFFIFSISAIGWVSSWFTGVLALLLFAMHTLRLIGWYNTGIWSKSLLWILYVGYCWIVLGFLLSALTVFMNLSPYLAVHAFAYGGIGLVTLGMMARVALGHTGRSVFDPPQVLIIPFVLLSIGVVIRVLLPIAVPSLYTMWVGAAQILWMISFSIIFTVYFPMLIKARVDGRRG